MPLQIRRGNDAERQTITPAVGELIYVTDTKVVFIGDGTTQGGVPVMNYSTGTIRDLAAEIFSGGSHIGINFTYDTATDKITAVVDPDLTDYQGTITASAFRGSFFADDSTRLLNGIDGSVNLDGTVKTNIVPGTDATYDLGTNVNRIRDAWFSRDVNIGSARIEAVGSVINLPVGSTVAGVPIGSGSGTGVIEGSNYKINIVSDDSTIMVNSDLGYFEGDLLGSIKGSVYGTDSSLLVDADNAAFIGTLRGAVRADDGSLMYDPNLKEITAIGVKANIYSSTNTLIIDHFTNTIFSSFVGNLNGDLKGSVFGNDSSMLIDGTNSIVGNPNGFTVFENSNIRINAGGNIIGKKFFSPALDPQVEVGSPAEPSSLLVYSNKKSLAVFGKTTGTVGPDIEFSITGNGPGDNVVPGDSLAAIRWLAQGSLGLQYVGQTTMLIDPREAPGSTKGAYLVDFPAASVPGDRTFIFDSNGNFYSPNRINTFTQTLGTQNLLDPTLFTELTELFTVSVDYTQLVNNAAESVQIHSYPAASYIGGKVILTVSRGTDTRVEEYLIFNNSTSANSTAGTAGGLGTNPVGGFSASYSGGNIIVTMTTDTNNLAGDVVKIKAKFELFTNA